MKLFSNCKKSSDVLFSVIKAWLSISSDVYVCGSLGNRWRDLSCLADKIEGLLQLPVATITS